MGEKRECVKCTAALPEQATGRPRVYCGVTCRRAGEHEIRRIIRALERLEEQRRELKHTKRDSYGGGWNGLDRLGRNLAQARKDTDADIAELEARLRVLVSEVES